MLPRLGDDERRREGVIRRQFCCRVLLRRDGRDERREVGKKKRKEKGQEKGQEKKGRKGKGGGKKERKGKGGGEKKRPRQTGNSTTNKIFWFVEKNCEGFIVIRKWLSSHKQVVRVYQLSCSPKNKKKRG